MKLTLLILVLVVLGCQQATDTKYVQAESPTTPIGQQIYTTQCASCHKLTEKYIGPVLKGARERWPNKELLYSFVKNPQDVIKRNDYAMALYNEYKQSPMMPYPGLSNADINEVLNYCDTAK